MPAEPEPAVIGYARSHNVRSRRSGTAARERSQSLPASRQSTSRVTAKRSRPSPANVSSSDDESDRHSQPWQAEGLADQAACASPDTASCSSPESAWHGSASASYSTYRSRLLADPAHRCVRVAENARGAQCLAIATGADTPSGVLKHVRKFLAGTCWSQQ